MGGGRNFPAGRAAGVVAGVVAGVGVVIVVLLLLLVSGRGHGLAVGSDTGPGQPGISMESVFANSEMKRDAQTEQTEQTEQIAQNEHHEQHVPYRRNEPTEHEQNEPTAQHGDKEQPEQPTTFESEPIQLLALGDSITLGVGDGEGGGYAERLGNELEALHGRPVIVTNLAVNGIRSDQLLDRLDREETRQAVAEATLMTVSIGGNDLMRVVKKHFLELTMDKFEDGRSRFSQHLTDILTTLRAGNADADIYILGLFNPLTAWFTDMPELTDILTAWNKTIREAASAGEHVYYVPVDDLFAEDGPAITAEDFVHPNESGHGLIAERALEVVAMQQPGEKGEGDAT